MRSFAEVAHPLGPGRALVAAGDVDPVGVLGLRCCRVGQEAATPGAAHVLVRLKSEDQTLLLGVPFDFGARRDEPAVFVVFVDGDRLPAVEPLGADPEAAGCADAGPVLV